MLNEQAATGMLCSSVNSNCSDVMETEVNEISESSSSPSYLDLLNNGMPSSLQRDSIESEDDIDGATGSGSMADSS